MDMDEVKRRINDGLIIVRKHPFLDLYIYNYTHRTQHEGLWDSYTERCRGLIMDGNNNILNNPFPKFFNLGQTEELMIHNLPPEMPSITEKLDGMLGILYQEGDNLAIATRGAFDSPHAGWATNWLRLQGYSLDDFKQDHTYLFEIIYPGNRIVVNYRSRAELVLLAVRSNNDESELNYVKEAQELGLSYAKEYSFGDGIDGALKYLEKRRGMESEGFVCKYSNGLRVKIKSLDYKRLHKILTGISAKDIWISLRDKGNVNDILDNVPDEFFKWVKKVEMELTLSKLEIMNKALGLTKEAMKIKDRKEQAEYIRNRTKECDEGLMGMAFFLLDGRLDKAEMAAWKRVKPSGEMFDISQEDI